MKTRRILALAFAATLCALPACKDCGKKAADGGAAATVADGAAATTAAAPPPWRALVELLPADIAWAVVAGDGAGLLGQTRALLDKLRGTTVGIFLEEIVRHGQHQMNLRDVDVYDPGAWRARGIEPFRGGALVQIAGGRAMAIVGVSDAAKAEALLQQVLRKVRAAATFKKAAGHTLALDAAGKPAAIYAFHQGYALVAGPAATELEADALAARFVRPDARRLIHDPIYPALGRQSNFGRGLTVLVLPGIAGLLPSGLAEWMGGFRGLSLRIEPSAAGAVLEAFVATAPGQARDGQRIFPGGPGAGLARFFTPDTVLAASARVDLGALADLFAGFAPRGREMLREFFARMRKKFDVDVEAELLKNLTGDAALAIHTIDPSVVPLLVGGAGIREILETDPFHLTLLLRVRDPVVARKFLLKVAIIADLPAEKIGAVEVFPLPFARMGGDEDASRSGPALRFALVRDALVVTLGSGRMAQAVQALSSATGGGFLARVRDADTRRRLEQDGHPVAHLVGETLAENLRQIEGALLRKGRLITSNLVQKATEVVERIGDVSLGGEALPEGQRYWLRLRLK